MVVLVAVGAIALFIKRTTDTEFRQYITHSGVQESIEYYQQAGSWEGVDSLLAEGIFVSGFADMLTSLPDRGL